MTPPARTPRPKAARIVDLSTTDEQVQALLQGLERLRQRLEEESRARAQRNAGQIVSDGNAVARLNPVTAHERPRWYYAGDALAAGAAQES